jgi:hypothetical protein
LAGTLTVERAETGCFQSISSSFISTLTLLTNGMRNPLRASVRPERGLGLPRYTQQAVEVVGRDALRVVLPHVHEVILNGLWSRGWSDWVSSGIISWVTEAALSPTHTSCHQYIQTIDLTYLSCRGIVKKLVCT